MLAADELDARVKAEARGYLRATTRTGQVDIEQATAEVAREYRFNNFGGRAGGQPSLAYSDDQGSRLPAGSHRPRNRSREHR